LTAVGVVIAFYLPRLGSSFGSSDKSKRKEWWLRARTATGSILIIVGTLLQMYAAWPLFSSAQKAII
jgi:uncharacterized membrane protein YidH (DUF202 family)